jgi:protein ImuA
MQRLLKGLGQSFCTYGEPHCRECPLRQLCASYLAKPSEAEQEKTAPLSNDQVCSSDPVIALRQEITRLERSAQRADWGVVPFGEPSIDSCMPHGGLQLGHWHEIGGLGLARESPAAVTGFVAALASATQRGGTIIWTLRRDDLYAPGLQAFGVAPDRLILVRVDKDEDVLSVQEDALRTRGVTAAIGEVDKIDLTAGRRLQLVCEKSGATGFVLRRKLFGTPLQQPPLQAPAAATRWRIAAASSQTQTPGLGSPRWTARLDRCRGGRTGAWIMEMQNASEAAPSTIRVVAELADHTSATEHAHAVRTRARHHDYGGQRTASGRN